MLAANYHKTGLSMSHGNFSLEVQRSNATNALYINLLEVIGPQFGYDRFLSWVSQYLRFSREFHSLDHILSMSELNRDLPGKAGIYSMVAGFFHDEDYPSIVEEITPVSRRFIDRYVEVKEGKKYVKVLEPGDTVGQMLHGIFGFKEGQELSPFPLFSGGKCVNPGGMNEFYSAAAAAGELEELGKDHTFIAAIITGIEATIAFRGPNRMNELRERLEHANKTVLSSKLTAPEIDEIMIAAVHTANKDVIGFLGGLDPLTQESPTSMSVVSTIDGGGRLSPEEVPPLRMGDKPRGSIPGEYTPGDFLKAKLKRAGLYHLVIPGNAVQETIPNLFYEVKLSDGKNTYPANRWTEKANHLAYLNNQPVRVAEYARLVSAGLIYSIAALAGKDTDPETVALRDMLTGMPVRINPELPPDASGIRKLAFSCVSSRTPGGHDTRRSPLAELLLSQLDENQMEELGKAARGKLFPVAQPEAFLELATEYLGATVGRVRDEMRHSAQATGKNAAAVSFAKIPLPAVKSI